MRSLILGLMILLGGVTAAEPVDDLLEAFVRGEVKTQGKYSFQKGSNLLDLWHASGGATPKTDLEGAVLMRHGSEIPIDLRPGHLDRASNLRLETGDTLVLIPGNLVGVAGGP